MKKFDVFVQGKFYKTLSANHVGSVLSMVANDIQQGLVPGFDSSKDHNIKIVTK